MVEDLYPWIVVAHVVGGFMFALAHGVSLFVAFRVRRESDPARIRTLLELSGSTISMVYAGLVLLLVAGIIAAVVHGWLRYAWPWLAIIILVVLSFSMTARGSAYYNRLRHAVGMRTYQDRPDSRLPEPVAPDVLARLLANGRPEELAVTGFLGLGVIIWLMVAKPF